MGVTTGAVAAAVGLALGAKDGCTTGVGFAEVPCGDGVGFVAWVPRLQLASAINAVAIRTAEPTLRMRLRFSPFAGIPPQQASFASAPLARSSS